MVYTINMRKAISVTLAEDNLLWLRGQAGKATGGNVSEILDRLVGEARQAGWASPGAVRSVVGSVDLPDDDPDLQQADAYLRSLFAESAAQPILVRERSPRSRGGKRSRG
jgi:hypothetical protein